MVDKLCKFLQSRCTNRHPSTKRNTNPWPKPVVWLHPFFIHHKTIDEKGFALFTPALQHQYKAQFTHLYWWKVVSLGFWVNNTAS